MNNKKTCYLFAWVVSFLMVATSAFGSDRQQVEPPDISGEWNSNIGLKYRITQNGVQFSWVDSNRVNGSGTIAGNNLTTDWTDALGVHSATGRITEFNDSGRPAKIVWSNGVIMTRQATPEIPGFREDATTGVRGEPRPCVSCSFCEQACPARLTPHLIYKYANKNRLEEAQRFGANLCVNCGLCSYVCPSKIDNKKGILEAQEALQREALAEEKHT